DIMFNYQKFLKCYIDVLSYQYEKDGFDSSKICKNLPLFIEYGTYRPTAIMLQSVGISRNTALLINPLIEKTFSDETDCLTWIKTHKNLLQEKIHPILYREIEKIL
ncbi:MAG: hypothetical protein ABFD66_00155, partial [Smithella sp.]